MHPLIAITSDLSDPEIDRRITDLTAKYWKTNNQDVRNQIAAAIDTYKLEIETRRLVKKGSDGQQGNDLDLDVLINIE